MRSSARYRRNLDRTLLAVGLGVKSAVIPLETCAPRESMLTTNWTAGCGRRGRSAARGRGRGSSQKERPRLRWFNASGTWARFPSVLRFATRRGPADEEDSSEMRECGEDLARDGVVMPRSATRPIHTARGLNSSRSAEHRRGFGARDASIASRSSIICAMRDRTDSLERPSSRWRIANEASSASTAPERKRATAEGHLEAFQPAPRDFANKITRARLSVALDRQGFVLRRTDRPASARRGHGYSEARSSSSALSPRTCVQADHARALPHRRDRDVPTLGNTDRHLSRNAFA